ncbi:hypothetical protein DUI87_21606 [Hirundo rustica rustica]|uniref:ribonuclease H n=1 Tax=Hirundo rustica rustica TaxID=333673 RepID=A0A3M0JL39_HIRRU|nr:hypothetical protein DUI87_21606 [Hirundo rustica rustica]
MEKRLRDLLPELWQNPETAVDNNNLPIRSEHLCGDGEWVAALKQAQEIPVAVLERIKEAAFKAFFSIQPNGSFQPYSKIKQLPSEPFVTFVERLTRAVELQVKNEGAQEQVLEEMALTNANEQCKAAILSLPLEPVPTLDDMLHIPLHPDDAPRFAFSVPTLNREALRKRYHWKFLPQGMKNSPSICQWYLSSLLSAVCTAAGEAIILHYTDDVLVCAPKDDLLTINSLVAAGFELQEEKIQRMPPWKYLGLETGEKSSDAMKHLIQAFSFLGIPKSIKTDNGPTYTSKEFRSFLQQWGVEHKTGIPYSPTEHLCGDGEWVAALKQAQEIPVAVLERIKEAAFKAFFSIQPNGSFQPYSKIKQLPSEPFVTFVERLTRAIELQAAATEERPTQKLNWKTDSPVWVEQWPLSKEKLKALQELVDEQLAKGHIVETTSPWNSPVFVIKKANKGKWRLLHDLRQIINVIEDTGSLQPRMPSPAMLPQNWNLEIIDIKDCFFQIPLHPDDAPRFAFSVPTLNREALRKRYHWKFLPQGMKNSPSICQWYLSSLLSAVCTAAGEAIILHYTDDVLVCAPKDDLLTINSLVAAGFELQEEKIQRMPPWKYLGLETGKRTIVQQKLVVKNNIKTLADVQSCVGP